MEQLMYCNLEHGWKTRNVSSVNEVVVYRLENSDDSPTLPENGIMLYPPENDEIQTEEQMQCTMMVTCKNPPYNMNITAVDILSSAKAVEVYSDKRDYIETLGGMRLNIEVQNENRVFLAQHTFEPPVTACMLKFVSRHRKKELYLHSVQISLSTVTSPAAALGYGSINLPEVRNMLGQTDTQMSDSAKALFSAMEAYQKNKGSATNAMFGGMMGNMMMSQMGAGASTAGAPNMAALAGMFATMGMGRNANHSQGDIEMSDGLASSSGNSNDKNSSQDNNDNTSSNLNDSAQPNMNLPRNNELGNQSLNVLPTLLPHLTQILETKLLEMEERICSRFSREVALSEQRITRLILERTGGSGHGSIDEAELDLD